MCPRCSDSLVSAEQFQRTWKYKAMMLIPTLTFKGSHSKWFYRCIFSPSGISTCIKGNEAQSKRLLEWNNKANHRSTIKLSLGSLGSPLQARFIDVIRTYCLLSGEPLWLFLMSARKGHPEFLSSAGLPCPRHWPFGVRSCDNRGLLFSLWDLVKDVGLLPSGWDLLSSSPLTPLEWGPLF